MNWNRIIQLLLSITVSASTVSSRTSFAFLLQNSILTGSQYSSASSSSSQYSAAAAVRSFSRVVSLRGGYDATIGPDPSNPIQFFTLANGMCPYAARTLIVLIELGLPYETVEITGKPDWYLKINPRGKVPALRVPYHGNEVVYESAICDEYLCDLDYDIKSMHSKNINNNDNYDSDDNNDSDNNKYNNLMPRDPMTRAKIRLLNDQCDTILNPAFFTFLMNKDVSKDEEFKNKLHNVLMTYEEMLQSNRSSSSSTNGPYLMGKDFTLADVHIIPFFLRLMVSLRHFKNFHITEENYPNLLSWFQLCSERESVKLTSKSEETIIEVYQKFVNVDYKFGGLNQNK